MFLAGVGVVLLAVCRNRGYGKGEAGGACAV